MSWGGRIGRSGRLLGINSDWAWDIIAEKSVIVKVNKILFMKPPSDRDTIRITPTDAIREDQGPSRACPDSRQFKALGGQRIRDSIVSSNSFS